MKSCDWQPKAIGRELWASNQSVPPRVRAAIFGKAQSAKPAAHGCQSQLFPDCPDKGINGLELQLRLDLQLENADD